MATGSTSTASTDLISVDPAVSYKDGSFTITGHVASTAGVKGVTVSALADVKPTSLGDATLGSDGTFSFTFPVGKVSYDSITATETDGAGQTKTAQAHFDLDQAAMNRPYVAIQEAFDALGERTFTDYYRADGSVQESMVYGPSSKILYTTTNNDGGSNTVDVQSYGLTIPSNFFDTFLNDEKPSNTFVFSPGHGLDVIRQFRVDGTDHDTVSLPRSDFTSIADVLRHTQQTGAGAVIHDPASGDTVRLGGITKAQLLHNQADFAFHP